MSLSLTGKRKVEALQNEILLCLENRTESKTKAAQPLKDAKISKTSFAVTRSTLNQPGARDT